MRALAALLASLALAGCTGAPETLASTNVAEGAAAGGDVRFGTFGYAYSRDILGKTTVETDGDLEAVDAKGIVLEIVVDEGPCEEELSGAAYATAAPFLATRTIEVGDLRGRASFEETLEFQDKLRAPMLGQFVVYVIAFPAEGQPVSTGCFGA